MSTEGYTDDALYLLTQFMMTHFFRTWVSNISKHRKQRQGTTYALRKLVQRCNLGEIQPPICHFNTFYLRRQRRSNALCCVNVLYSIWDIAISYDFLCTLLLPLILEETPITLTILDPLTHLCYI